MLYVAVTEVYNTRVSTLGIFGTQDAIFSRQFENNVRIHFMLESIPFPSSFDDGKGIDRCNKSVMMKTFNQSTALTSNGNSKMEVDIAISPTFR